MITLFGKSVFGGIAIGRIAFYKRNEIQVKRKHIDDTEKEVRRFEAAKTETSERLQELYTQALEDVGENNAAIFEIHRMMLEDVKYAESVINVITTRKVNAEYAVEITADNFAAMFAAMDDAYMQGRAADVKDVSERVIQVLSDEETGTMKMGEPVILAADDLAPSEAVQLDKDKVLSFVTMYGSLHSHTSIIARTMNIPSVIGLGEEFKKEYDGKSAIVDGSAGVIYIDPDAAFMEIMQEKQQEELEKKRLLEELKGKENVTKNGRNMNVYANIGGLTDVDEALKNDTGGIGLFRSEFIYLESRTFPTEEQQFKVYKQAVEHMEGKELIIRTLDIGADKQADYFELDKEENPALGYRGIRICLTRKDIFKTQLRAIYRASVYGQIAIMFPMIISVSEVHTIKEIIEEVQQELVEEGAAFKEDIKTGILIETPAAVMISRELAKEVDFLSIGTNDLTQYTLAIDRQNQKLQPFYDEHHPAVFTMIRMSVESAHAEGKRVGICGELAADLSLTQSFLEMGIDFLSVAPGMILPLRKRIRECE